MIRSNSKLQAALQSLSEDEQTALVAIAWVGRGDFEAQEWPDALALARERRRGSATRYLMGMPMLGDYLEEGAAALGVQVSDEEAAGLHHCAAERQQNEWRSAV